ncbi:MAG: hypothetical protein AB8G18_13870 [Gammaproteobacteria bacterium]
MYTNNSHINITDNSAAQEERLVANGYLPYYVKTVGQITTGSIVVFETHRED